MVAFPAFDQFLGGVFFTQGIGDADSGHDGYLYNSSNFGVPFGTEILAIAGGVVVAYYDAAADGDAGPRGAGMASATWALLTTLVYTILGTSSVAPRFLRKRPALGMARPFRKSA